MSTPKTQVKSKPLSLNYALVDTYEGSKYASFDTPHAQQTRKQFPNHGWCLRCGRSNQVQPKTYVDVYFRKKDGSHHSMSPACKECWDKCEVEEQVLLCKALFRSWLVGILSSAFCMYIRFPEDHPDWVAIEKSVRFAKTETGKWEPAQIPTQIVWSTNNCSHCGQIISQHIWASSAYLKCPGGDFVLPQAFSPVPVFHPKLAGRSPV